MCSPLQKYSTKSSLLKTLLAEFSMSTDNDDAIYSEVSNDIIEMKKNTSYSDVKILPPSKTEITSKSDGGKGLRRRYGSAIVISMSVIVIITILAATSAGVIVALIEISKLKIVNANLSTLRTDHVESPLENVTASLDRYTQELAELRQSFNLGVQEQRAEHNRSTEELTNLRQNFSQFQYNFQQLRAEVHATCPAHISSCSSLPSYCPSGYYWLIGDDADVIGRVYCDMTFSCGGVTGGWMRVAELNMPDTRQRCPSTFVEKNESGIRQCRVKGNRCYSVYYHPVVLYSRVCGRITAYQVGTTNAFLDFYRGLATTIDSDYVTGVSLTHGTSPRQHIWTFAAALDKAGNVRSRSSHCPCQFEEDPPMPPPFVGEDYFCDAGNEEFVPGETGLQTDPLWDGTDCLCCVSDSPPWFYKQLPQPTTDRIEMRVCKKEDDENIGITEVEIYVQ